MKDPGGIVWLDAKGKPLFQRIDLDDRSIRLIDDQMIPVRPGWSSITKIGNKAWEIVVRFPADAFEEAMRKMKEEERIRDEEQRIRNEALE